MQLASHKHLLSIRYAIDLAARLRPRKQQLRRSSEGLYRTSTPHPATRYRSPYARPTPCPVLT
eukprot:1657284-Rhodomonas_salina.5